jgi:hypothetical protein
MHISSASLPSYFTGVSGHSVEPVPLGVEPGDAEDEDDADDLADSPNFNVVEHGSGQCPRNDALVRSGGWTCLRKCNSDGDCISKKKKCICDGPCGKSCAKPGTHSGKKIP